MRESCMYGSVRGALSNERPYRNRREFIALLGGVVAWPLAARAQQPAMPVIGVLNGASEAEYVRFISAFRDTLREIGYVEGQNVAIEYRWANGQYDQLPALAANLIRREVTLIFAIGGIASAFAAKAATTTIPIVFANGSDPVKLGLIPSLSRPAGNVTGIIFFALDLEAKRVEPLHELVPQADAIGFLLNESNPNANYQLNEVQSAAHSIGQKAYVFGARSKNEIATAFANAARKQIKALAVLTDPFFLSSRDHIVTLAAAHGIAVIYPSREFPDGGGLVSYGTNIPDAYRQAAVYVARILKGARPEDLPVQQPTKFELVINLKTAKALGLDVPPQLLARADEVLD
jgi:putative tryptophan/tyrosine transport system substrate-binding protein